MANQDISYKALRDVLELIAKMRSQDVNDRVGVTTGIANLFGPVNITPREMAKNKLDYELSLGKDEQEIRSLAGKLSPELGPLYNQAVDEYAKAGEFEARKRLSPDDNKSWFSRTMDVLSRGTYTSANIADEIVNKGNWDVTDWFKEAGKGLTGKDKTTYEDITGNKLLGFLGDVLLDPTTYIGVGAVSGAVKGATKGVKTVTEGQKVVDKVSDSLKIADDEVEMLRGTGVSDDVVKHIDDGRAKVGTVSDRIAQVGKHREKRSFQIRALNEAVQQRELVDRLSRLTEYKPHISNLNDHIRIKNNTRDQLWKSIQPEVQNLITLIKNNPQASRVFKKTYGVNYEQATKKMIEEVYAVRKGTKKLEDTKYYHLMNYMPVHGMAPDDIVLFKLFTDDIVSKLHNQVGSDIFDNVGGTFRHHVDASDLSHLDVQQAQEFSEASQDIDKLIGFISGNKAKNPKGKTEIQHADDLRDTVEEFSGINPEFKEFLESITEKQAIGRSDDFNEINGALKDIYHKYYGPKIGTKVIPLIKSKDGDIWSKMEKIADKSRFGAVFDAMDKWGRSLRSVSPAVAHLRDISTANAEQLSIVSGNKVKQAYNSMSRSADRKSNKDFWETGRNEGNLIEEAVFNLTKHYLNQPAIVRGVTMSPGRTTFNDAFYRSIEGINQNLNRTMRLSNDQMKALKGRLDKEVKEGKRINSRNNVYDDITKIKQMKILREAYKGSGLQTTHKTMSSLVNTMNMAATQHMHRNAFVEGLKGLGVTRKDAKGFRKLEPKDFSNTNVGSGIGDRLGDLKFNEDDIPGIVKGLDFMFSDPSAKTKVVEKLLDIQRNWKILVTAFNLPGYYINNSLGDLVMNTMNDVGPVSYAKATKLLSGIGKLYKDPDFVSKIDNAKTFEENLRLYAPDYVNQVVFRAGGQDVTVMDLIENYVKSGLGATQSLEEIIKKGGIGKNAPKGAGRAVEGILGLSNKRDNYFRMANYIHSVQRNLKQGKSLPDAFSEGAQDVRKYNFDFTDFTPTERKNMTAIIPFYRYMRKSIPLTIKVMMQNPGRLKDFYLMQEMMGSDVQDPVIPSFLKSGMHTPIGEFAGDTAYFRYPNPMIDTLAMIEGRRQGFSKLLNVPENIANDLTPGLEIPYQLLYGKSIEGVPVDSWKDYLGNLGLPGKVASAAIPESKIKTQLEKSKYVNEPAPGFELNPLLAMFGLPPKITYNTSQTQASELKRQISAAKKEGRERIGYKSKGEIYKESYPWLSG